MYESSKCFQLRQARGDFDRFLRGNGIDIGAGPDPLKVISGSVRAWDVKDGDAQLMRGVADASFDFVYSSHCLEHTRDVPESLFNWLRILKPGGAIYVVVPDYMLYEKFNWPSRFNSDHKQSFCHLVPRDLVGRPNHWHMSQDLVPLLQRLGLTQIEWRLENNGFNFNAGFLDQTMGDALAQIYFTARKGP